MTVLIPLVTVETAHLVAEPLTAIARALEGSVGEPSEADVGMAADATMQLWARFASDEFLAELGREALLALLEAGRTEGASAAVCVGLLERMRGVLSAAERFPHLGSTVLDVVEGVLRKASGMGDGRLGPAVEQPLRDMLPWVLRALSQMGDQNLVASGVALLRSMLRCEGGRPVAADSTTQGDP
jgi:hypothetical protein